MAVAVFSSTVMAHGNQPDSRPLDLLGHVLLAATALALAWWRRRPEVALAVSAGAAAVIFTLGYPLALWAVPALIAVFSAIAAGRRSAGWAGAAFLVAVPAAAAVARADTEVTVAVALWALMVLLVVQPAEVSRARRAHTAEVERRAAEAERTREEEARRRAQEERLRVSRELHDVTSHTMSVIALHAAVAAEAVERAGGPPEAAAALRVIRTSSRQALAEMKAVLGVLRPLPGPPGESRQDEGSGESAPLPLPGTARLPELLRTAGLPVTFEVEGRPRELSSAVDLTVYRVVQEALTNTMRHAGATTAAVTLTYEEGAVTVRVDDDGRGSDPTDEHAPQNGPQHQPRTGHQAPYGHGLTGMAERVTAAGGSLIAGNGPDGGFRVTARLPA